jgi:hypothetical protein
MAIRFSRRLSDAPAASVFFILIATGLTPNGLAQDAPTPGLAQDAPPVQDAPPAPAPIEGPAPSAQRVPSAGSAPRDLKSTVVDPAGEERKAKMRASTHYRDPNSRELCPPPYRMTERDGCQPPRR